MRPSRLLARPPSTLAVLLVAAISAVLPGCAGLRLPEGLLRQPTELARLEPPNVRVAEVRLARSPTNEQVAMHLCAQLASERGLPGSLVCGAFGRAPTPEELTFAFEVELEIANPNRIELPLAQALVAFRAWPEEDDPRSLGAVCVSLCEDPSRCPSSGADACRSSEPEIRDLDDFAGAAATFLVAVARGERSVTDLRVRTIPPGETIRAIIRLELDPDTMMALVRRLADDAVSAVQAGRAPVFDVPYEIEGAVWVEVESFGRFAASFGPFRDRWRVQ